MKDKSKILAVVNTGRRKEKDTSDERLELPSNVPSFHLGQNGGFLNPESLRKMFLSKDRNDSSKFGLTLKYLAIKKGDVEKPIEDISRSTDGDVPLNDFTILTSLKSLLLFLRKDIADIAKEIITFAKGLKIGQFVSGMIGGSGAKIDENGDAEMNSLILRDSLIVPNITFNNIDVVSGDKANTFAYGTILKVVKDEVTDPTIQTGTAWLELLDDERGTLAVDDLCRGIFHNLEGNNSSMGEDSNGFYTYSGFSTSYFTPTSIVENKEGVFCFKYVLQAGTSIHPMKGMNFFAYGNMTDPDRQSITYENRDYRRILAGVSDWVINPDVHIKMQSGLLGGINIGGMIMQGYGTFLDNVYLTGAVIQFTKEEQDKISAYSVILFSENGIFRLDQYGAVIGKPVLTTFITASKGSKFLQYSDVIGEGFYKAVVNGVGCNATIGKTGEITISEPTEGAYVDITINCEGFFTVRKRYNITVTQNGKDGDRGDDGFAVTADLDNEVDSVAADTEGNVRFGLPVETHVSMWGNGQKLTLSSLKCNAPEGVTIDTPDVNTGTIRVTGIEGSIADVIKLPITVSAPLNGKLHTRSLLFTINKVQQGEKAVIHKLNPSVTGVTVDNKGIVDTNKVSCSVVKHDGSTVTKLAGLPSSLVMTYSIDGGTEQPYTYGGLIPIVKTNKTLKFILKENGVLIDAETIVVLKNGTDGKNGADSVSYEIITDHSVIKKLKNGTSTPTSISFQINEKDGTAIREVDKLPAGYKLEVYYDGVLDVTILEGKSCSAVCDVTSVQKSLEIKMLRKEGSSYILVDAETIPVLRDGDGESPLIINLTNDNGTIECDSKGNIVHIGNSGYIQADYQPSTTVTLYHGINPVRIDDIKLITPTGNVDDAYFIYDSVDYPTEATVYVRHLTSTAADKEPLQITVYGMVNNVRESRTATFYINKIRNGKEGSDGADGKYIQTIYTVSDDKPARPSFSSEPDIESSDWLKTLPNIKFEPSEVSTDNVWQPFNGYYRSNAIGARGFTKESLRFNFDKPTWVKIELVAHCEPKYDMGYIGNLDQNYTSKPEVGTYITSMSGNGYKTHAYLLIPSGRHYVQVMYAKDSSGDSFGDYVECRALSANRVWVSSSEAIFDRSYSPARWKFTGWTDPQLYDVSSGEETVYLLAELKSDLAAPYSDPDSDKYLPVVTNDLYDISTLYTEGQKTGYNNRFYENIKQCQGIFPTNTTYWKEIPSWTHDPKELGDTYTVQYVSKRVKTDNVWGSFSKPVVCTMKGEKGPDGAMPRYCGEFEQGKKYIYGKEGNSEYRDIVIYGTSSKMVYQVKNRNSVVTAAPTEGQSDENWELASKFSFVAMNTALIEGANIGGLLFKNQKMVSQDGQSLIIDGATGEITAKKANITGIINSTKGTIGGFTITETSIKNGSLKLFDKGLLFTKDSNRIGIGDCFPPSTGIVGLIGMDVVLNIGNRTHVDSLAALSIEVTGGGTPLGSDARQRGLRVITSGGSRDYALDIKGKIMVRDASHPNGMDGKTEVYYVSDMWGGPFGTSGGKKKLTFINGLLVSVDWP